MNRRHFVCLLPAILPLSGCDTEQKPASDATALNNEAIQAALKSMDSSIAGLEGDVGRFESENWREVVPDVETSAAGVRGAFSRLRRELGVRG